MALEDFLGGTSEIKIFDFLAENMDISYNQTEISELTGLSRPTVNKKIPEMIHNNVLKIENKIGNFNIYRLEDNEIVKMLIAASLGSKQAENPDDDEQFLDIDKVHKFSYSFFDSENGIKFMRNILWIITMTLEISISDVETEMTKTTDEVEKKEKMELLESLRSGQMVHYDAMKNWESDIEKWRLEQK